MTTEMFILDDIMVYEKSTGYVYKVKSYNDSKYYIPINYCPVDIKEVSLKK